MHHDRIDRSLTWPRDLDLLTSEARAELSRVRKQRWELRREKDLFRLAAAHFALGRRSSAQHQEPLPPRALT